MAGPLFYEHNGDEANFLFYGVRGRQLCFLVAPAGRETSPDWHFEYYAESSC